VALGHPSRRLASAEYASVSILLVFAVEVILLVIAFDVHFFTHPFYVIDAIIIGALSRILQSL
jgi:hypothetical protein